MTGALVATPTFFAQILEGPEAHLTELMASIRCDPRHRNIRLLDFAGGPRRDFADWSPAHSGEAAYVSRMIGRLMEEWGFDSPKHVNRLYFMIREFTESDLRRAATSTCG